MVLTGGAFSPVTVQRYNKEGFVETLHDLNEGRFHHGCSTYLQDDGKKFYIVTGGRPSAQEDFTSTTEVLAEGNTKWRLVGNLPAGLFSGKMATLDNRVFFFGRFQTFSLRAPCFILGGFKKIDGNFIAQGTILEYLDQWTEVGTLLEKRGTPGVSTVSINSNLIGTCD